jgi:hypothetical protein
MSNRMRYGKSRAASMYPIGRRFAISGARYLRSRTRGLSFTRSPSGAHVRPSRRASLVPQNQRQRCDVRYPLCALCGLSRRSACRHWRTDPESQVVRYLKSQLNQALPLPSLRGRSVDLKHRDVRTHLGPTLRKSIEPCSEDDVLTDAARYPFKYEVLHEARTSHNRSSRATLTAVLSGSGVLLCTACRSGPSLRGL